MPVIKNECVKDFVIVPNELAQSAQNGNISYEALGVLLDMISRPTNWEFNKEFYRNKKAGHRIVNRVFRELQDAGYLKIEYLRENNKIKDRVWCVSNKPIYKNNQNLNETKRYAKETMPQGNALLQIHTNTNTELKETNKEKENTKEKIFYTNNNNHIPDASKKVDHSVEPNKKVSKNDPSLIFSKMWEEIYPKACGDNKTRAWRNWSKLVKCGYDEDKLLEAAKIYREECRLKGTLDTQWVKLAANFYGENKDFEARLEPKYLDKIKWEIENNAKRKQQQSTGSGQPDFTRTAI
jgi:hypothetical protein